MEARYRLEEVAGVGATSTVWRAYDLRLQRPVAIKVMSDTLAADAGSVRRFAREARTHAGIWHPNLVRVYDHNAEATQPYLVMEYVDGVTLARQLDSSPLSPARARQLARELLGALACVHEHGVLHRDIKPANVLIDAGGHARLTDFGLARLEDATRMTSPGEVVGTLHFLAPELLKGRSQTRQSDLFALGILLQEATGATGRTRDLDRLITCLTRPEPAARPADARAALALLDPATEVYPTNIRVRRNQRVEDPPAGRQHRDQRPRRQSGSHAARHASRLPRRLGAAGALGAAMIAVAVVIATSSGGGQPNRTAHRPQARTPAHQATKPTTALTRDLDSLAATVRHAPARDQP